ncbi:hypothetical protein Ndes2437B_g04008 [Nannochloris sp. 'desiccata']
MPLQEPNSDNPTHERTMAPWSNLSILGKVFDFMTDPKDLVACACVCKNWGAEVASSDHLFKASWTREISDQGLWRWSRAAGGYRDQLRANSVVRKGDCVASVFPINRREGKISEVLLLDAKPEPRICTMHYRPPPTHCIRLTGWTVKVWSSATLCNSQNRPLCTIHDVVKQLQLGDGRLFLWRIQEGAIIRIQSAVADQDEEEEGRHWAENANLIASILDPITLELVDVPLDSSYGQGRCPFEFMDGGVPGVLVIAGADPLENRIKIRLMDLHTGQCFRESSITLPEVGPDALPLHPEAAAMLMSRNSDVGGQVAIAGAALYDCRVFRWRLKNEWMSPETRFDDNKNDEKLTTPPAVAPTQAATAAVAAPVENAAANNTIFGDEIEYNIPNRPYGTNNSTKTAPAAQFSLHHIFTTVNNDPICDLSMSTAAKRIYVVGLENLYVLADDGTLQFTLPMHQWRGVHEARIRFGNVDVGAFSWPLPNSTGAAFYLDVTNSLYVANFENAAMDSFPMGYAPDTTSNKENGQYTLRDRIQSLLEDSTEPHDAHFPNAPAWVRKTLMPVESHTDLLPKPKAPSIVEKTIFTSGDSSCAGTAALLKREKEAGTYLYGLGPKSVGSRKGKKAGPFVSRPGVEGATGGSNNYDDVKQRRTLKKIKSRAEGSLAPRAIICIDTETGRRYKSIPIEGIIESIHAAGHLLVAAVAPVDKYPDGAEGSLVVIDFSKEGFGLTDAQHAEQRQVQRNKHSGKNPVGGDLVVGKKSAEAEAGLGGMAGGNQQNAAVAEAGPSKAKRSRRSGN